MEERRPLLAVLASLVLAGCGSPGAPSRHELIDSRDNYDPRSLDPALSTDVPTGRAVGYLFDGLTRFTPDAKVEPALASRWDVSPDGRTYTFHLRTGVTFHDGTSFTARNVVSSWQRALDPKTKSGAAQFLFPIKGARAFNADSTKTISGLTVRDDTTLTVTLAEPLAIFTKMLAMPVAAIVPTNVAQNFGEHPVGTGPWKLVEWKHDDYLLFARNPSYFGGAWIFQPDPIDFTRYQMTNIYTDSNAFRVPTGPFTWTERYFQRTTDGHEIAQTAHVTINQRAIIKIALTR